MKKLIVIGLSILTLSTQATNPDTTSVLTPYKLNSRSENINTGALCLVSGLIITGVGIIKERTREPYPYHSTSIDYNPNAPQPLNLMLMGAGLGLSGYGMKLIFTF